MKAKALKITVLVAVILICLSAILYAAHSSNQAKVTSPSVTAPADNNGQGIPDAVKSDRSVIRRAH